MTAREIRVELPAEPPMQSVVLVELSNPNWVGPDAPTSRLALQRLGGDAQPWHVAGRESVTVSFSWAEVIGRADGRPILVLWEPS